ncbi:MAG: hypothetical protein WCH76_02490 [Candidatus Riflemargulisbacteria bacterium]
MISKFSKALHNLALSLFFLLFIGFSSVFSATTAPTGLLVQGVSGNTEVTINATVSNVYFQATYNSTLGYADNYKIIITTHDTLGSNDYIFWGVTDSIKNDMGGLLADKQLSQRIYYQTQASADARFYSGNWLPLEWRVTYNYWICFHVNSAWSPTANSFFRVFDRNVPSISVKVPTIDLSAWHSVSKDWMTAITVNFSSLGVSKLDRGEYFYNGVLKQITGLNGTTNITKQLIVSFSALNEGINPVTIYVSDNAGNLTSYVFYINRDTQLPTINVSTNLSSNPYFAKWITQDSSFYQTISVSFVDQGLAGLKDISAALLNSNGSYYKTISRNVASASYNLPWGFSWSEIPQGLSQLLVSLNDNAENTNKIFPLQIRKDQIPPYIYKYLPTASYENRWFSNFSGFQPDGSGSRINLLNIDIDFVDTQSYVESIRYAVSNNNSIIDSGTVVSRAAISYYLTDWQIPFAKFNNGYNEVYVSFNDNAGLSSSNVKVFSLQKDTVLPQLTYIVSDNSAYLSKWYRATPNSLATINFTASDNAYSKLNSIIYYVNNEAFKGYVSQNMNVSSYNFRLSDIPSADYMKQGTNNLWIRVVDNAGNLYEESILKFQRDVEAPALNLIDSVKNNYPPDYNIWTNYYPSWVTVNNPLSFSDIHSGIAKMEYYVSNNIHHQWTTISVLAGSANYVASQWMVSASLLTEGVNTIWVSRNDVLGNSAFEEFIVKLDFTSPNYHSGVNSSAQVFQNWYNNYKDITFLDNIIVTFSDSDAGHSLLKTVEYVVENQENQGAPVKVLLSGATQIDAYTYIQPWGINWLKLNNGTNNISVRVVDNAKNETISPVLFSVKKDISSPNVISSETVSDNKFINWYSSRPIWMDEIRITFNDEGYSNLKAVTFNVYNSVTATTDNWPINDVLDKKAIYLGSEFSWGWLVQGISDVYSILEDNAGNISKTGLLFTVKKDIERPNFVTHPSINVFQGWYRGFAPAIPTIQIHDVDFVDYGGSSLNYIGYVVEVLSGGMRQYDISKNMNIGFYNNNWILSTDYFQDGTNNVYVVVSDNAGNLNSIYQKADLLFTIKLDSKNPSFDKKVTYGTNWTNTTPDFFNRVTLDFYDEGYSLLKDIYYIVSNNSNWLKTATIDSNVNRFSRTTPWIIDWALLTNGVNEILVSLNDNAGWQIVSKAWEVRKDIIPPSFNNRMTLSVATYNYWYNAPQPWMSSISVSFTDAGGSGISKIFYRVNNASNVSGNVDVPISVNFVEGTTEYLVNWAVSWGVLANGVSSISVLVSDNAGNLLTSNCLFWIKKDITTPNIVHNIISKDIKYSWRWYNHAPDGRAFYYDNQYYNELNLAIIPISFEDIGSSNLKEARYIIENGANTTYSVIFENRNYVTYRYAWGMNWALFSEGTNDVKISVTDNAGNNTKSDVLFSVKKDGTFPSYDVYFISIPSSSYFATTQNWMKVNSPNNDFIFYDQNLSKIKRVYYKFLNDGFSSEINVYNSITRNEYVTYDRTVASFSFSFADALQGYNEIYAGVEDFAENKTEYTRLIASFNKDTYVPIVNKDGLFNPPNSWINEGAWLSSPPSWWEAIPISFEDQGNKLEFSGIKSIEYSVYHNNTFNSKGTIGGPFASRQEIYNGTWSIPWDKITSDLNIIMVSITDNAGNNHQEELFRIKKDILTTNIVINAIPSQLAQNKWYKEAYPSMSNIDIDFYDGGMSSINMIDYVVSINGRLTRNHIIEYSAPSNYFIQNWSISFGVLAEGTNDILIYVSDNAANLVTTNVIFSIKKDSLVPSYNVTDTSFFTNERWYNTTNIYNLLPITVRDMGYSGLEDISLILYNNGVTTNRVVTKSMGNYHGIYSSITTTWPSFNEGVTQVRLSVTDNASNNIFSDVLFSVRKDQSIPTWSYTGAHDVESLLWYGRAPTWLSNIQISFRDTGGSNVATVSYAVVNTTTTSWYVVNSSVNNDNFASGWSISWNNLLEGLNGIKVKVEDGAGNVTASPVLFTIYKDSTYPSINHNVSVSIEIQNMWYNTTKDWMLGVTFNVREITDNAINGRVSSLNGLGYMVGAIEFNLISGNSVLTLDSNFMISFALINEGTNNVYLLASDNARNITSVNVLTIKKDVSNPKIIDNRQININSSFNVWYNSTPNFCVSVNVDFSDSEFSLLSRSAYVIFNSIGITTYDIFTSTLVFPTHNNNWNIYWYQLTNNIITIDEIVEDHVTNT